MLSTVTVMPTNVLFRKYRPNGAISKGLRMLPHWNTSGNQLAPAPKLSPGDLNAARIA